MIFKTVNKVFNKNIDGTHKGLDNCKQRLKLSSPQRHSLEITNENNTYSAILKL
ncbi:MAG: hypothetical protein K2J29_06800 [Muribaculaceae bacterium]|nr:hypothetical protein [Muribaculaceae bacterium]MDE6842378.1 hypothetical protein [Muribaculaceae bacterium]